MKNMICENCNCDTAYNSEFDVVFCPKCDKWLEKKCTDPECDYCANRPEKPSDATMTEVV